MHAGRFELGGDGRDVVKLPDLHGRADRQAVAVDGQTHRGRKTAEMRVQVVPSSRTSTTLPA